MIDDYRELNVEIDMLHGNINRICLTDNIVELNKMLYYAELRLKLIYEYNEKRINSQVTKLEVK